jgi:glutaredoxin 2
VVACHIFEREASRFFVSQQPVSTFQEFPDADVLMAESMDIIELIDSDERFGPTNAIRPASGRTDLKEWQKSVQSLLRTLQRPRYVATGLLPEFQQKDARHAFIVNHQLPPYDKEEWKSLDKEEKLKIYEDAMAADPAPMIEELNARLVALDDIVYCEHYCTEGGLSLDDIDLWARLRSVSIIRDVEWPNGLRKYMDNMSELADVPLYDALAM